MEFVGCAIVSNLDNPNAGIMRLLQLGTIKAFSMLESEQGEIPEVVLKNARVVARKISKKKPFSVFVQVERVGQTINTPIVKEANIN